MSNKSKNISISDDDGDTISIDIGTVCVWIDTEKSCLVFTEDRKDQLIKFATELLEALKSIEP